MMRRPPRSTQSRSSAASDVYKRQPARREERSSSSDYSLRTLARHHQRGCDATEQDKTKISNRIYLSLIHISEPTRLGMISYAVFCLKKKKKNKNKK